VLGRRALGQRRQLGRVLPGQLARQGVGMRSRGHQPSQPAGRRVIEILVVVVGHAAQMAGQVGGPPFRAWRRGTPGPDAELGRQLADDGHAVAISA
jgi:hypothetical protein